MAEWLGGFMSNWPVWAVVGILAVIVIIGLIYYFAEAMIPWTNAELPSWRKKKNGKK